MSNFVCTCHKDIISIYFFRFDTFDLLFTNPPFGGFIPINDPEILSQYDLGHNWTEENGILVKTSKLRQSAPPEQLFTERCLQLLKPGGKMAIVLPDSILSNPGLKFIRKWILQKTHLLACVDLPIETFQPFVGTKTNIVFLEKKSNEEINQIKSKKIDGYDIFMACAYKIGHDRRGNPLYRRDSSSDNNIASSKTEGTMENNSKILDDDLPEITRQFKEWWKKNA